MAKNTTVTCDWKVTRKRTCGDPGPIQRAFTLGRTTYAADLCPAHDVALAALLVDTGFSPTATRIGGKARAAYVGASGKPFSGSDARPWLIEQGLATANGRLSGSAIAAYADAH